MPRELFSAASELGRGSNGEISWWVRLSANAEERERRRGRRRRRSAVAKRYVSA
jgi:hypothetical protein